MGGGCCCCCSFESSAQCSRSRKQRRLRADGTGGFDTHTYTKSRLLPPCCTLLSPISCVPSITPQLRLSLSAVCILFGHCWFIQCHVAQTSIHQSCSSTRCYRESRASAGISNQSIERQEYRRTLYAMARGDGAGAHDPTRSPARWIIDG